MQRYNRLHYIETGAITRQGSRVMYNAVLHCDAIRWEQYLRRCRLGQIWHVIQGRRQNFRPKYAKKISGAAWRPPVYKSTMVENPKKQTAWICRLEQYPLMILNLRYLWISLMKILNFWSNWTKNISNEIQHITSRNSKNLVLMLMLCLKAFLYNVI